MTDLNSLDDEQLIHSVLNGNREVFSRLVERYQRLLLSLCRQRISDSFEAENAAQDVSAYHLGGYILFGRDTKGKTACGLIRDLADT